MLIRERAEWRVSKDWRGELVILDLQGRDPLKVPEREERLANVKLAAGAPVLYNTLAELVRRLEYLTLQLSAPYRRDVILVQRGHGALTHCHLTSFEVAQEVGWLAGMRRRRAGSGSRVGRSVA